MASFDKAISPGQEGKVTLKVDTKNKRGRLNQIANIFSNDPQNPKTKIAIMGSIKHYISVTPSTRLLLQGYHGDKIIKKVTITSHEEQPLKITDITSTIDDKIEYDLKPIEKGKEFSFEIKTPLGIKESFKGKVTLKTNSQKKPKLELVVMGKVRSEVKIAPQFLDFGIIDTKKETIDPKSLKRTVTINKVGGNDLILEKIEPSSDWIMTEIETNQKGEKYTIVINLDKNKLLKGKFKEKVKIHTKHKRSSEVTDIILKGKVI
ncbi:MAG: hypothetical protein JRE20_04080 [Deltaproteobacteria bacterium]|nr:hypothetical protein [Deltaproteobacteria bacterium]